MTSRNNLKEQNTLMSKTVIRNWDLLNNTLSPNTFDFCRKALNFSLNSTRNLGRWNNRDPPNCDL